jgi:hypothetical protein
VGRELADEVASSVGEFYSALHLVESVLALGGANIVQEDGELVVHDFGSGDDEGVEPVALAELE